MPPVKQVVWDTNVAISLLENTQGRIEQIAPLIEEAEAGRLLIVLPETSVVELRGLRKLQDEGREVAEIREIIRDFLDQPYIVRRPLHRKLADLAWELALVHGIKRAADAVVLALAKQESIATIHTYDGGLIKLSGKVGEPPIVIGPPDLAEGTLFSGTSDDPTQ